MKGKRGFTLIELLVVVLILLLLATIAVGVYIRELARARYATAKSTITEMDRACARYQIDLGVYPPSGSLSYTFTDSLGSVNTGCGFLEEALLHSIGGSTHAPSNSGWMGPYLNVQVEILNPFNSSGTFVSPGDVQIIDPWKSPYRYVRQADYAVNGTKLPTNSAFGTYPYAATETWFNPSTCQIVSKGPNGVTNPDPNYGTENDDVSNFGL